MMKTFRKGCKTPEDIVLECRLMGGNNPSQLIEAYKGKDFNNFAEWEECSEQWGFIDPPEWIMDVVSRLCRKRCYWPLLAKVLAFFYYPFLQCRALGCFHRSEDAVEFMQWYVSENKASSSLLWSILDMWKWRICSSKDFVEDNSAFAEHYSTQAQDLFSALSKSGHVIEMEQWMFSYDYKGYKTSRQGKDHSVKVLFSLLESELLNSWKPEYFSPDIERRAYMVFIGENLDNLYKKDTTIAEKAMSTFDAIVDKRSIHTSQPYNKYDKQTIYAYAEIFEKSKTDSLVESVKKSIEQNHCHFMGWLPKVKVSEYHDMAKESFRLSSFMMLAINVKDKDCQKQLMEIIEQTVNILRLSTPDARYQHVVNILLILRCTLSILEEEKLVEADKKFINEHKNLHDIVLIFSYTSHIPLSNDNRKLLAARWKEEKEAWEHDFLSTQRKMEFKNIENSIRELTRQEA